MATTIDRHLGRDALLDVVGDPFAFWLAYQSAATRSGGKAITFSAGALRAIERLHREYRVEASQPGR